MFASCIRHTAFLTTNIISLQDIRKCLEIIFRISLNMTQIRKDLSLVPDANASIINRHNALYGIDSWKRHTRKASTKIGIRLHVASTRRNKHTHPPERQVRHGNHRHTKIAHCKAMGSFPIFLSFGTNPTEVLEIDCHGAKKLLKCCKNTVWW